MGMRQLKITPTITNRDERSLEKYLSDVNAAPKPMTGEEEHEAGMMVRSGTPEQAEMGMKRLIVCNLRFVVSVAKQYKAASHTFSTSDLIQYGNEGLIKAASKFDPTRGFKFISYAVWWIRQRIMQAISDEGRSVRLPLNQTSRLNKARNAEAYLQQLHGREPSNEEVLHEIIKRDITRQLTSKLGIDVLSPEFERHMAEEFEKELRKAEKANFTLSHLQVAGAKTMSLDAYVSDDHQEQRYIDRLASNSFESHEREQQLADIRKRLNSQMTMLSSREREVITRFFGLDGRAAATLDEMGNEFELSRERVRQIKEKAMRRLKSNSSFKHDMRLILENLVQQ